MSQPAPPSALGQASASAAPPGPLRRALAPLLARAAPYAPALLATAVVGGVCIRAILARAGHPALPLDDSFIHLQFARRLAEGSFFGYVPGEGYSSGATSLLWPMLLAPFYKLGLRDVSLVYASWLLGSLAHAGVAVEAARLARPLAGRAAAAGAGAMCAAFAAFAWFAWSGMETMALAWILARTARVAAGWCEPTEAGPAPARTVRRGIGLAVLGALAPLVRPEGVIASLLAAVALTWRPPEDPVSAPASRLPDLRRLLASLPLAGILIVPGLHWALAGHPTSSTTTVKWLLGNPNYDGPALRAAILGNVRLLFSDILDGGNWTGIFLPEGSTAVLILAAAALAVSGYRRGRPVHAAFVAAIALGTLLPCTYLSFLWNRVRYVWPFAPAWFVMVACLAREIGDLAVRRRRSLAFVTPMLAGACAGALAMRFPWAIHDLAQSAHAIDRQQVWLGRWAAEHLPADARIGVNDTGAIAYLSGRKTFDVVGLTTEGEAPYWVAGAGSRFEHYERLPRERLPTHFIVYRHWMACPPVLGRELAEATVHDQAILGGATMTVYEARYDTLGSGAAPVRMAPEERVLDEVDVADLESEKAHAYERVNVGDQQNQAVLLDAPESDAPGEAALGEEPAMIADGGRFHRRIDRFTARAPAAPSRLVMRVASDEGAEVAVFLDGKEIGAVTIPAGAWVERGIAVPAAGGGLGRFEIAIRGGEGFHAFHYWIVGRDET